MSGVWVFGNGKVRLVEDPTSGTRKALQHTPSGEVVRSYASLEPKLVALGWERYYADNGGGGGMLQYHNRSADIISLPKDFAHFGSVHMNDIVNKTRDAFRVIDV